MRCTKAYNKSWRANWYWIEVVERWLLEHISPAELEARRRCILVLGLDNWR